MKNKTVSLICIFLMTTSIFISCTNKNTNVEVTMSAKTASQEPLVLDDINYDDLDSSIKKSILATSERLPKSELTTSGHIFLGSEIKENFLIAYIIAGVNNFEFQNGILTSIASTGAIPTVIKYNINPENKRYTEVEYLEPNPNADFKSEVNSLFPAEYINSALNANAKYPEIEEMQINEALDYLDFLERDASVQSYIDKKFIDIIPNNYFLELAPDYPTWEGTIEKIEDGIRYIYETTTLDSDNVLFTKKTEDNVVTEKFKIDTNGHVKILEYDSSTYIYE